jgi:hypothetical protein
MTIELAWAAGFWDGEGCCHVSSRKGCRTMAISLSTSQAFSPEYLIRFQEAVEGLGKVRGPYTNKTSNPNPYWTWTCNRLDDIHRVMEILTPYLSTPKREQYEKAAEKRSASIAHLQVINKPTKEELERMYWVEEMTLTEIGSQRGVTVQCVSKWMKKLGIATKRTSSKSFGKTRELTN